jgi:predicted nucleic acid-binding protein
MLVGDLVLCEVLRGIPSSREHAAVREILLGFELVTIGGVDLALEAADAYRTLRQWGVTVRKTIDLLIGTWCIVNNCALLHSDRDFDPMARHLGLRAL